MKVLIIDDEPLVAKTLARLLRGHEVEICLSAHKALELILSGEFDLVFCDLMMPELSGRKLFEKVWNQAPELSKRIVFITGGAFTSDLNDLIESQDNRVLYKPFNRETLKEILDSASA
jgi:two-component system cell cycle sensor histidine kinase/response regulator CckA